jgi:hypothetical protein
MEGTFPSMSKTRSFPLPLGKELAQGHAPRGKDPEVAVQREDIVFGRKGEGSTDGNSFLADAGEPLADFALAQEGEHFFLYQAGVEHFPIET